MTRRTGILFVPRNSSGRPERPGGDGYNRGLSSRGLRRIGPRRICTRANSTRLRERQRVYEFREFRRSNAALVWRLKNVLSFSKRRGGGHRGRRDAAKSLPLTGITLRSARSSETREIVSETLVRCPAAVGIAGDGRINFHGPTEPAEFDSFRRRMVKIRETRHSTMSAEYKSIVRTIECWSRKHALATITTAQVLLAALGKKNRV